MVGGYNDTQYRQKLSFLRFLRRLFIFFFVFLLGFALAKRWGVEEGITGERIGVIEVNGVIKDSRSILENLVN
jgi:hypothetical protein